MVAGGRRFAAGEEPVEGVARPFAFRCSGEFRRVVGGGERAEGGVGKLAVNRRWLRA